MTPDRFRLPDQALRWCCDVQALDFETTDEVEPVSGIVGQDDAVEALAFGLEIQGPGQNVFIRGLAGTGRMTLVRQLLEQNRPRRDGGPDRCFVHNFEDPSRPTLLSLERGSGPALREAMESLIEFIKSDLPAALGSEALRSRRALLDERMQREIRELGGPSRRSFAATISPWFQCRRGPRYSPSSCP